MPISREKARHFDFCNLYFAFCIEVWPIFQRAKLLRKNLPAHLRPVIILAFNTGVRKQEILGLQWSQVDLMEGKITLRPEDTKSKEGRVIYLQGELLEVINFQRVLRDQKFPKCPWVFPGPTGERIREFRGSWATACINAGLCKPLEDENGNPVKDRKGKIILVPTKIFHDFRRSAVRNLVRSGVPERVAMAISGHKTRSVFERYNIVDEKDLKEASKKMEVYLLERQKLENKHSSSTVQPQEAQLPLEDRPATH